VQFVFSEEKLPRIFAEYQQAADAGLAIVHHLGELLTHPVAVRSWPGKGSVFSIEVPVSSANRAQSAAAAGRTARWRHSHRNPPYHRRRRIRAGNA